MSRAIYTGFFAVLNGAWALAYDTGWRYFYVATAIGFAAACAFFWQDAMKPRRKEVDSE